MSYNAYFYLNNGKEFFHLDRPSTACKTAVPFEFDGPATVRQKEFYQQEYAEFLNSQKISTEVQEEMKEALALPESLKPADELSAGIVETEEAEADGEEIQEETIKKAKAKKVRAKEA